MSILLTGGTGYIASHTAVELLNNGYDVILADNLSNSDESVVDAIEKACGKRPVFYLCDVCDSEKLNTIFQKENIDAVVHFAGYKAVGESVELPLMYYRNNLDSMISVLELMKKNGCKKLIFSSSATVYGEENPIPYVETMRTGGCSNPYGRTKFFIEEIIKDYAASDSEFSAVLLRYFNPIGSHESGLLCEQPKGIPNNLFPYVYRVATGEYPKLNVFGNDYPTEDGTCERDFIHVMDLAAAHMAALKYADKNKGAEWINVGTGKPVSVLGLVKAFEKANGVKIPYEFAPRRAGDLPSYYADASKAKKVLGWEAKYSIEDACKQKIFK